MPGSRTVALRTDTTGACGAGVADIAVRQCHSQSVLDGSAILDGVDHFLRPKHERKNLQSSRVRRGAYGQGISGIGIRDAVLRVARTC